MIEFEPALTSLILVNNKTDGNSKIKILTMLADYQIIFSEDIESIKK